GRRRALRAQRRPLRAGGRARPVTLQRDGARGDVRPDGVSGDRRPVVPAHARAAWVLLVPAAHAAGGGRVTAFTHHLALSVPEESLREFVLAQRWFGAKSREIAHVQVVAAPVVRTEEPLLALALVEIRFHPGTHELYHVPLGFRREW